MKNTANEAKALDGENTILVSTYGDNSVIWLGGLVKALPALWTPACDAARERAPRYSPKSAAEMCEKINRKYGMFFSPELI